MWWTDSSAVAVGAERERPLYVRRRRRKKKTCVSLCFCFCILWMRESMKESVRILDVYRMLNVEYFTFNIYSIFNTVEGVRKTDVQVRVTYHTYH